MNSQIYYTFHECCYDRLIRLNLKKKQKAEAQELAAASPAKPKHFKADTESEIIESPLQSKLLAPLAKKPSPQTKSTGNAKEVDLTDVEEDTQSQTRTESPQHSRESPLKTKVVDTSVQKLQKLNKQAAVSERLTAVPGGAATFFGGSSADHTSGIARTESRLMFSNSTNSKSSFAYRGGNRGSSSSTASLSLPAPVPGSLEGKKFAVTGVMEMYGREQIEEFIMSCGGKVPYPFSDN
jgi:NAD-dependent DNA ligase